MQTPKNRVIHRKCGENRVVHPLKIKNVDKLLKNNPRSVTKIRRNLLKLLENKGFSLWINHPQMNTHKKKNSLKSADKKFKNQKKWINVQKNRKKSEKNRSIIHKRLFFSTRRKKLSTNIRYGINA